MANPESIESLFPYIEHRMDGISKPIISAAQFYSERFFNPLVVEGLEKVKELKSKNPDASFIYISCHKSHLDYIETQLALGNAKIPAIIQAGDNLFIGPLDPLWRKFGAFMAIREGRGFYSKDWIANTFYSLLPEQVYKKGYEVYVDKVTAKNLYEAYLTKILSDEAHIKDVLIYPEYVKQADNTTKYGRSYSGELLKFSPYIFIELHKIISQLDNDFFFVPVNPSYERVIEDYFMGKVPKLKERFSRDLVYLQEYGYITTRPFFPFFTRGKFVLKFGEPFKIKSSSNIKADSISSLKKLRYDVGFLQTPFSPQVIFYSMDNEQKVEIPKLEDKVMENISCLDYKKVDTSYLKKGGSAKSIDTLLDETLRLFDAPGRRFVKIKAGLLEVLDKNVASQYANHIRHLF